MPDSFQQRFTAIENKAALVIERYRLMSAERDEANRRVRELEAQVESYKKEVEKLSSEIEYLKIANTLSPSAEDISKSREFLSELVWEIDKCINQLSE